MAELRERYGDDIYRPGDDVSALENLSEKEMSDRRKEIASMFENPELLVTTNGSDE